AYRLAADTAEPVEHPHVGAPFGRGVPLGVALDVRGAGNLRAGRAAQVDAGVRVDVDHVGVPEPHGGLVVETDVVHVLGRVARVIHDRAGSPLPDEAVHLGVRGRVHPPRADAVAAVRVRGHSVERLVVETLACPGPLHAVVLLAVLRAEL